MTPEEMARIHARSMTVPAPWGVPTFTGFLGFPGAILGHSTGGFALGRVIADEAELLTLAVIPEMRRQGVALRCLTLFETEACKKRAERVHLEVGHNNEGAIALYTKAGYTVVGRRAGYYRTQDGTQIDALLMAKHLVLHDIASQAENALSQSSK